MKCRKIDQSSVVFTNFKFFVDKQKKVFFDTKIEKF